MAQTVDAKAKKKVTRKKTTKAKKKKNQYHTFLLYGFSSKCY